MGNCTILIIELFRLEMGKSSWMKRARIGCLRYILSSNILKACHYNINQGIICGARSPDIFHRERRLFIHAMMIRYIFIWRSNRSEADTEIPDSDIFESNIRPSLEGHDIFEYILRISECKNTHTTLLEPTRLLIFEIFPSKPDFHLHKWEKILPTKPY